MTDTTAAAMTAQDTVTAADAILHDVGTAWMIHEDTGARAVEHGYGKLRAFYFAGRGGVLGDVDADVVIAAFGWWDPGLVRLMWERGTAVGGAREGARRYAAACTAWAEDHLTPFPGVDRLTELAEKVVTGVEGSALSLFAGWRAEPRAEGGVGRLLQLVHVLREWRGGLHLVATTAAGLSPLAAVLGNEGEAQARFLGWRGDLPDFSAVAHLNAQAEETTNRLAAAGYEKTLTPEERAEFAALVAQLPGALH